MSPTVNPESSSAGRMRRRALWLVAIGVLALVVCTSVVFVEESEFVIVETLGRIAAVYDRAGPTNNDRGLHFKFPLPIPTVPPFDPRPHLSATPGPRISTR